jgi:predicted dehydrogenase
MGRKLRIGMVGLGFISAMHLEGYEKCPEVEIAAFCDIIPERAQKAAIKYGVPGAGIYSDYKKMIAEEKLDAISVCTENNMHAEISIAALNAGLHVFCEKPMAITGAEADDMVAASRKNNRKLSVGYQLRFSNESQLLRREVVDNRLGKVYYAEATTLRRRGVPTWGVFLNKEKQGGGPLIDTGTHIVDLTLWTMNDYSPVVSAIGRTFDELIPLGGFNNGGHWDIDKFEVEDSAFGTVTLASGAMLVVKAAWACNIKEMNLNETLLLGVKGGAELENDRLIFNGESNDRLWQNVPETLNSKDSLYDREIAAWVKCLAEETEPIVKCEQAAQVVKVLEAIYISARNGGKAVIL